MSYEEKPKHKATVTITEVKSPMEPYKGFTGQPFVADGKEYVTYRDPLKGLLKVGAELELTYEITEKGQNKVVGAIPIGTPNAIQQVDAVRSSIEEQVVFKGCIEAYSQGKEVPVDLMTAAWNWARLVYGLEPKYPDSKLVKAAVDQGAKKV
jgi:hypothetical protein